MKRFCCSRVSCWIGARRKIAPAFSSHSRPQSPAAPARPARRTAVWSATPAALCYCANTVNHATDIASTPAGTNHRRMDRELGFIAGSFSI